MKIREDNRHPLCTASMLVTQVNDPGCTVTIRMDAPIHGIKNGELVRCIEASIRENGRSIGVAGLEEFAGQIEDILMNAIATQGIAPFKMSDLPQSC